MNSKNSLSLLRVCEIILGILLIALGIYTLSHPLRVTGLFVLLYAISAIVTGIFDIIAFAHYKRNSSAGVGEVSIISAIFTIIIGIILLFIPDAGKLALAFLFPLWFILHSIMRLDTLKSVKESGKGIYWFTLIINVICIILGISMLFNPATSIITFTYIVAFYLFAAGFGSIGTGISTFGIKK